ncbi:MAG: cellulase family glycosylhydrolase [Salinivirgaceae bacterium]|nr:cellulase family glycosylhydrolase [Salinivirgaceae bacterium]
MNLELLKKTSLALFVAAAFVCCDNNSDPVPEPTPAPQPDTAKVEEAYNGVYVDGRYLKSPDGKILTLHGFAQTYSPWFNEQGTRWSNYDVEACLDYNQGLIDDIQRAGWAMDFVRLHMDPYWSNTPGVQTTGENDISAFDETRFKDYLDDVFVPMAEYITRHEMYVVMRPPGVCPHVIKVGDKYQKYLLKVWNIVSKHKKLKNNPMVMFELANEPVDIVGTDGSTGSWSQSQFDACKEYFQAIVDRMRENGCKNVLWIPGPAYQGNYAGFAKNPVEGENIGYAVHVYPGWMGSDGENPDHGDIEDNGGYESFQKGWDEKVKPVADFAPVTVTEMDWAPAKYNKSWGKAYTGVAGGSGFGANFKLIADKEGNVSWLLFTSPDLLAKFTDKPGTEGHYTFLNDPEACPWPCYHWFRDYASGVENHGSVTGIGTKLPSVITKGGRFKVEPILNYEDGYRAVATEGDFSFELTAGDSIVSHLGNGVFAAVGCGPAAVRVTVTDGDKTYTSTADFEVIDPFDFSASVFDPSIWETGTYDETTRTFSTGQYGFAGWRYPSGADFSGARYLVIELESNESGSGLSFRLFDKNNYWSDPAMFDFGSNLELKIDLTAMKDKNKNAIDPAHIYIAGFWTVGGKKVTIKDIRFEN